MNSDKNNIDKLIKTKVGDHEMMPDDDVWNSIEASILLKNKYKYIYKGITITGVVAIVSMCIFYLCTKKDNPQSNIQEDSIRAQPTYSAGNIVVKQQLSEPNAASYISKNEIINHSLVNDSLQVAAQQPLDSLIQPATAIVVNNDTSTFVSVPIQSKIVKKVVKKPLYVIQQDTIYKIDSLKRRKIK